MLALAKGLIAHGVRFGDRVAMMSVPGTSGPSSTSHCGRSARSGADLPTSSAEQCFWTLHEAECPAAVVEHEDHAMTIAPVIDRLPQ